MSPEPSSQGGRAIRIGNYVILKYIATGGMGAVYKALDRKRKREVALKVLSPEQVANKPMLLERFRLEARYGRRLNHENVVSLYKAGEVNGIHYLALEFVDGEDLHEYVARRGKVDVALSREIMIQATRAIDHLHQHGIIHRDIKPANFLVTQKDGKPFIKLIDLGLAHRNSDDDARVTQAGSTLGTVDYMSPEQARDSRSVDIRSDIYSLGCTWFHLLAGRAPFAEGTITERVYKHIETPPPDIRDFNPAVGTEVIDILQRMLAKDPADRYPTPAVLLRSLEAKDRLQTPFRTDMLAKLARGDEMAADQPGRNHLRLLVRRIFAKSKRLGRNRKFRVAAVLVFMVAILILGIWMAIHNQRKPSESEEDPNPPPSRNDLTMSAPLFPSGRYYRQAVEEARRCF